MQNLKCYNNALNNKEYMQIDGYLEFFIVNDYFEVNDTR